MYNMRWEIKPLNNSHKIKLKAELLKVNSEQAEAKQNHPLKRKRSWGQKWTALSFCYDLVYSVM